MLPDKGPISARTPIPAASLAGDAVLRLEDPGHASCSPSSRTWGSLSVSFPLTHQIPISNSRLSLSLLTLVNELWPTF